MTAIPAILGSVALIAFIVFLFVEYKGKRIIPAEEPPSTVEALADAVISSVEQVTEPPPTEEVPETPEDEPDETIKTIESPSADHLVVGSLDKRLNAKLTKMIATLPPLPRAAMNLLPMFTNPSTSARDIAKVVSADPLLAAKILRRVNSSYYGLQDKIDSIHHAVMLIGFDNVRSITLRESFDSAIETTAIDDLTANLLWAHSAAISLLVKHFAQKAPGVDPELAGTAGLLHDFGLLVMMALERHKLSDALKLSAKEYIPLCSAEERILGYNHQVLGEMLGRKWNLSEELVQAIGRHHSPLSGDDINPTAAIIWFAHNAATRFGYAYRLVAYPQQECEQLAARIGIRWPIFGYVTQTLLRELQKATTLWEIQTEEKDSPESVSARIEQL